MTIDYSHNSLTIEDVSLESFQKSQLFNWGFKSDGNKSFELSKGNPQKSLLKVINYFDKQKIKYKTTKNCVTQLKIILNRNEQFHNIKKLGRDFKDGTFNKNSFKEFVNYIEENIPRKLKSHQIKAAYHLYLICNGANFSVPGSGKTSVVLSVYERLKGEGKVNVLFVVGPPSCFGPWKNEFYETLGRKPKFRTLAGGDKRSRKSEYFVNKNNKAELYLTTFHTLLKDQSETNTLFSQKGINVFLVIDEAHYIKQVNGNWASAVMNITKHSRFRCILTGTPIPKGFSDIFNLFDFLWPEDEPIDSYSKNKLQSLEKSNNIGTAKIILENRIGPLFYRVRKKDLGLTKPIFHDPIILTMNKYEQIIYNALENKIRSFPLYDYLSNIDLINKLKRGRMIRMRQTVSYTYLLNSINEIENYGENIFGNDKDLRRIIKEYNTLEVPSKFEFLANMLQGLKEGKEKVVIWTNFIGTIDKLQSYITKDLGLYCRSIQGKTPIEQTSIAEEITREQIRDEFVNEKSGLDILIANPAACAESISLHKTCHKAIYYDLSYNCAQYLQSLDRIHRVGGSENMVAHYYFLQYKNSIDQDILNNLLRKANKMKRIIDDDYRIYSLDMFEEDDDEIKAYDRLFGNK